MRVMATYVAKTMGVRHNKALAKWPCVVCATAGGACHNNHSDSAWLGRL